MDAPKADSTPPRVNTSLACEACRASKVRCSPSSQAGICKRCHESKRECIFKTGPRTRRPRQSKLNPTAPPRPPPPGPSKTFTIDIPFPTDADLADSLDALRLSHEAYIDELVPLDGVFPPHPTAPPSTSSSSTTSRRLSAMGIQPQFNMDSAAQLLASFRAMLPHFPCLVLPPDATVAGMAGERPFVLLAVLAAASGSRALQGHTLYDEEFRKILGLKFVAGGERTVELLVGLLVYCAWYPSHLRPRNKQSVQYVRMAVDIVRDLELDHPPEDGDVLGLGMSEERLDGIRAYLACYYLSSTRLALMSGSPKLEYTPWLSECADILEANPVVPGDRTLPWLVRFQHIMEETSILRKQERAYEQSAYQAGLMIKGMEAQLDEWRTRIPPDVSSQPVIELSSRITTIFLYTASLLGFTSTFFKARPNATKPSDHHHDPARLAPGLPLLRSLLSHLAALPPTSLARFCAIDWSRFVLAIVLAFRLSFPLPHAPAWDDAAARQALDFGGYLDIFCGGGEDDRELDIVSAFRAVLRVVRRKYERRVEALGVRELVSGDKSVSGCPMLDGSMSGLWDETFVDPSAAGAMPEMQGIGMGMGQAAGSGVVWHDLWATMTTNWTQGMEDVDFEGI